MTLHNVCSLHLPAWGQSLIISEQGTEVAREFGANMSSVKTSSGVQEVFALALRGSMKGKWDKIARQQRCVVIRPDLELLLI